MQLRSIAALIVIFILPKLLLASEAAADYSLSQQPPPRREKVICGPNAVYAMLSACSVEVDPLLVDELLRAHPTGMSLSDVRDALSAAGVSAAVRHCTASQLSAAPTPYVAYLKFELSGGHYLVVLSQDKGLAHVLDPTTGEMFTTRSEKLLNASAGYVIVPSRQSPTLPMLELSITLISFALLGCYWSPRLKKAVLASFIFWPLLTARAAMAAGPPTLEPRAVDVTSNWRSSRNSGTNCLWLLLNCAGKRVDYAELRAQTDDDDLSLDTLRKVSLNHGLKLVPIQLTFDELRQTSSPFVLFMEPEGIGSGTFALLVDINQDKVNYIEGGGVRWVQQSRGDFRRSWSGYALTPAPATDVRFPLALRGLSIVGLLGAGWCIARSLSTPKQTSCVLILLLLSSAPESARAVVAANNELPEDVRRALEYEAAQLAPLTVSWVLERERVDGAATMVHDGQGTRGLPGPDENRITVQAGMLYTRTDRGDQRGDVMEHSFDGVSYFIGRPPLPNRLHQASLTKMDVRWLAAREPQAPWFSAVYLDMVGFSIPSTSTELNRCAKVQSRVLKLLADGGKLISCANVTMDGRQSSRVEIETEDPDGLPRAGANATQAPQTLRKARLSEEQIHQNVAAMRRRFAPPAKKRLVFFLDPQRGYALTYYEEKKANGSMLLATANERWQQVPQRALWLPQQCRITHYTRDNRLFDEPVMVSIIRATSFDAGAKPDALFTLNYSSPGTKVHEQWADGRRESYEIPATPADLSKVIAQARDAGYFHAPRGLSAYWWVFVAIGLAVSAAAIAVTVYLLRHAPKRRS
jgi:hypothetical protein